MAILAGACAFAAVAVTGAGAASPLTWHDAAKRARFHVYRPHQTLGLKQSGLVLDHGCLLAGWGTRTGPHFGLYEPGDSVACGQPGEATTVAKAVINGVGVDVLVQCPTLPKCTIKDGERKGELLLFVPERAGSHYSIQLQSMHIALGDFLKVARSFRRIR
ncbi:MAG TPA: hypothetical protein VG295_03430 [Solirubrobacteraceae bacterium]|nr:hypothetical protein [Solirubrobacteraceae bacterium]